MSAYIIIYEYDITNNSKMLLYSTLTEFDNNEFWYCPGSRDIKDLNYIKVEIRYNEFTLKEEIIKIR